MEVEALRLKQSGNDAFQQKDYEGAVEHYSSAIKLSSSSVLHSNRAAAYIMLGWWDQALRDTKAALRKDGTNVKALERKGKCLLYLDRLDEALDAISEIEQIRFQDDKSNTEESTSDMQRLHYLVRMCRQPHSIDECQEALKEIGTKAFILSPLGLRIRKALANALLNESDAIDNAQIEAVGTGSVGKLTRRLEDALHLTSDLLQDYPDDAEVSCLRSRALVRAGKRTQAEFQIQHGLQEAPDHIELKALNETMQKLGGSLSKGNELYKEGKFAQAIQFYTAGLETDFENTDIQTCARLYYNRAAAERRQGEFKRALDDVNMSLVLLPKWAKALYRRGILLLECGQPAQALSELKIVQRADPTFAEDLQDWIKRAHCFLAKPRDEKNHYEFMRLPMDATKEDIKRQYKKLCLLWHPDKNQTEDGKKCFAGLQESFAFLLDEEQRCLYDYGKWKDREVSHYMKRRTKAETVGDDVITALKEHPWIDRTREGREWLEEQLAKEKTGDPAWLEEKTRETYSRWYSQEIEDAAIEALQAAIY